MEIELNMKLVKNDLKRLHEQSSRLHKEKIKLEEKIEDLKAWLGVYQRKLDAINYDIDLNNQYIEIIKKREGLI